MLIIPSEQIEERYEEIVKLCKTTKEPVYLTKDGQNDLVVMDAHAFEKMKQEIVLKGLILEAHASLLAGEKTHSAEETFIMMDNVA